MDVRITLEKPWAMDAQGKEIPMVIRYGSTPARIINGGGSLNIGSDAVSNDEFNDAGSHMDTVPRTQRRTIPGKRIEWTFLHDDKDQNGFFIPYEAARLWFGNWRCVREAASDTPYDQTFAYEKKRVAMQWGWWEMPRTGPSGLTHLKKGEEGPDTTKIGAPRVPHVLIESVDNRGKTTAAVKFRPWDLFRWQDDVVSSYGGQSQQGPAPTVETFTPAQLRAIADEIEARQKAQK
jgi:hypothetical protein